MLRTVRLYGTLGARFGREHRLDVRTPREAVQALCANFPAFERELATSHERGVGYRVLKARHDCQEHELAEPVGADEPIRIAPWVLGGGKRLKAFVKIYIGVSLIVGGIIVSAFGHPTIGSIMVNVGVAMVVGGVTQLLTPTRKLPDPSEQPGNTPSYTFDGPVNTLAQGQCVPVGYGRMIVGSAVISAGISVEEYAP